MNKYKYEVRLNLYTYNYDVTPAKRTDVTKLFVFDSWEDASNFIGLMADATNSLCIDIDKKEVEA